jgi:hypothetical protein
MGKSPRGHARFRLTVPLRGRVKAAWYADLAQHTPLGPNAAPSKPV